MSAAASRLAELGVSTVYEAAGRCGLVEAELVRIVPGSSACGPARTVRCGQGDNLAVHAVMERIVPGEVVVLSMPEPAPVAVVGDLLVQQAQEAGAVAVLVDAAVRDADELVELGLPVWARWVRSTGASKDHWGELDVPVTVGGAAIAPGDLVVLDGDGAVVVAAAAVQDTLAASEARARKEAALREAIGGGAITLDLMGLREGVR